MTSRSDERGGRHVTGSEMRARVFALICAMSAMLLSGCAHQKHSFDEQSAAHVRTISIVVNESQEVVPVLISGHPAAIFGLIGGIIIAADAQSKAKQISDAMQVRTLALQEQFSKALTARLRELGYEVSEVTLIPADTKFDDAFGTVKDTSAADAVLSVRLFAMFRMSSVFSDYLPRIETLVRKQDRKTGQVLYAESFVYGWADSTLEVKGFTPLGLKPEDRFADIPTIAAEHERARRSLLNGGEEIARRIAGDLSRKATPGSPPS